MPELPDVQVFKEYVDATSLRQRIDTVHLSELGLLQDVSGSTLRRRLRGERLVKTRRHGKHLFIEVGGGGWLRLHFGMTGDLKYYSDEDDALDHQRLVLDFEGGAHLGYRNMRKLGQIGWVSDPEDFIDEIGLGPDPLESDLDLRRFRERLAGRRGTIKGTLMNQSVLAGLGNVYTDEILFQSRLHPRARTDSLDEDTVEDLFRTMNEVLERSIAARAKPEDMPGHFLLPNRHADGECPECGRRLTTTEVSGRTTYYCSRDQQRKS